jgi:hypothetical protein
MWTAIALDAGVQVVVDVGQRTLVWLVVYEVVFRSIVCSLQLAEVTC